MILVYLVLQQKFAGNVPVPVFISENETVGNLRILAGQALGINTAKLKLFHHSYLLRDSQTLKQASICANAIINVK
jgi:hypothetical protein